MTLRILVLGMLVMVLGLGRIMAQQKAEEDPVYDKMIRPVHVERLEYPPLARQARIQGIVVVRARIDTEGNVVSAVAISGHELLIPACLENSMKWRFRPNPNSVVVIIYDFGIDRSVCGVPGWPCTKSFTFRPPNIAVIRGGAPVVNF